MNNSKKNIPITIGIPAYNEEANIKNLLLSILAQKEEGFSIKEIIVISDGSTDNTVKEILSVKSRKIKLITGKERKGQIFRQNEMLNLLEETDYFLLLESDTLPANNEYIKNLVSLVPENGQFSMIVGNSVPVAAKTFFEKIVCYGQMFKMEVFEKAANGIHLYLCGGQDGRLFSPIFLKTFRWDSSYHDDSYSFRKAQESNMPIVKSKNAKIYFKSVENLNDYFLQSGKFQKAKNNEEGLSDIYELKLDYLKVVIKSLNFFFINPILFSLYFVVAFYSRIHSKFFSQYTVFWDIYTSTKKLK